MLEELIVDTGESALAAQANAAQEREGWGIKHPQCRMCL
jgi:hypothetical protein